MLGFVIRRLKLLVITLFGVSVIVFGASRLSGDVVYLLLPEDATNAQVLELKARLGLDQPIWVQYLHFARNVLVGDFGTSLEYQRPTLGVVVSRLPATVQLATVAFVLAMAGGLLLGVVAATNRGTWIDSVSRVVATFGQSAPNFWIGMMLVLVFAVTLGWLPTSGRRGLEYMILPTITLAVFPLTNIMRITRSSMLETLDSEYVKFLRVKGISERSIVWKHALRNALIPVLALSGIQLGNLLSGSVIVETVFAWPGIGSLMVEAIVHRDYPLIQTGVLLIAIFLLLLNLIVDLSFGYVDPRIRYE